MMSRPPSHHASSLRVRDERRRERRIARLALAAAALDARDAVAVAEEALPFDNEALMPAERRDAAASSSEGRGKS